VHGIRVDPGTSPRLAQCDTGDKLGLDKKLSTETLAQLTDRLSVLQANLYAEHERAVLLVLQGPDASGKDGTIRRVFTGLNPQGCEVHAFKAPSDAELDHDFLWRIHNVLPPRGDIGIFNRSHYEDVVTAKALGVIDEATRKKRLDHINAFEKMVHDEGTSIIKVFLNVGKEEQRSRLQARLDDPKKHWKFNAADLDARAQWDTYAHLYDEAIAATSTSWAPWYIVPADHKWVSGITVARILVTTLEDMDPKPPKPHDDLDGVVVS
jgi:PPK2 family polyphosphate:nucleotide phosphotransferase